MKLYIEPAEDEGTNDEGEDERKTVLVAKTKKSVIFPSVENKKQGERKREFKHSRSLFAAARAKHDCMIVIIFHSKNCCLKYPPKSHNAVAEVPQSGVMHVLKTEEYIELTVHR